MAPRPRKYAENPVIKQADVKQADAVAPITGPWLKELIRTHVLGPNNNKGLPTSEACNIFAHYLESKRKFYQDRPRLKERDDNALASWQAISFLLEQLPAFCDHASANIEAMRAWENFDPVESEYRDLRKTQIAAQQDAIRRINAAIEGLQSLAQISPAATPFKDHCFAMPPIEKSWHDYSLNLAMRFIKFMEPTAPGLKLSNNGPVAKFVFHLIPSISGEIVNRVDAVAKHIQRADEQARTKQAAD